jgi:hypothetical protein
MAFADLYEDYKKDRHHQGQDHHLWIIRRSLTLNYRTQFALEEPLISLSTFAGMTAPAIPPEVETAEEVWRDGSHEFHYPAPGGHVPEPKDIDSTQLIGRIWDGENAKKLMVTLELKPNAKTPKIQVTGQFPHADLAKGTDARQIILTNHFELMLDDIPFYEYEMIGLEGAGQTRNKTQALFRKAIAQWTFLKDEQSSFASDGQKTIISCKNLHNSIDATKLVDQPTGQDNVWAQVGARVLSLARI